MNGRAQAHGFTLLEVMIAGVLLSVLSAGTLAAFSASHQMLLSAQYRLEAMNAARQDLETFEGSSFDGLETTTLPVLPSALARADAITPAGGYKIITVQMTRAD